MPECVPNAFCWILSQEIGFLGLCPKYFAGKCPKFDGFCPKLFDRLENVQNSMDFIENALKGVNLLNTGL